MASYTLKQISKSVYQINHGGKKAGFVNSCPKGFVGRIGKHCEIAATPQRAFELVAAKALGFSTPEALHRANQVTRQKNREVRQKAAHAIHEALENKNLRPMFDLFKDMDI